MTHSRFLFPVPTLLSAMPAILMIVAAVQWASASNDAGKSDSAGEPLSQKVEWLGVEVVTDRPRLAADIRGKIPLSPHTTLDFPSDNAGYKQWCDSVRATYPTALTSCSPVLMGACRGRWWIGASHPPRAVADYEWLVCDVLGYRGLPAHCIASEEICS